MAAAIFVTVTVTVLYLLDERPKAKAMTHHAPINTDRKIGLHRLELIHRAAPTPTRTPRYGMLQLKERRSRSLRGSFAHRGDRKPFSEASDGASDSTILYRVRRRTRYTYFRTRRVSAVTGIRDET